jgi:capsular polysaccharide export protein
MELLRAVRQAHPTAWVLYKPHPDVCAGLRRKGVGEDEALSWCDEIITDVTMAELLPQVDELHVLTSLTGFEALLRGKPVTCHGQPFYSGWWLTTDLLPVERRTRKLQLDELVAGSLILYPRYVARKDGRLTTPERALDDLLAWREESGGPLSPWQRLKRVCVRQIVGVR